jgi:hypothetical protein
MKRLTPINVKNNVPRVMLPKRPKYSKVVVSKKEPNRTPTKSSAPFII